MEKMEHPPALENGTLTLLLSIACIDPEQIIAGLVPLYLPFCAWEKGLVALDRERFLLSKGVTGFSLSTPSPIHIMH